MANPITPNSPEFSKLRTNQKRSILEARTTERFVVCRPSCICEKCKEPPPWLYEPDDARALRQWGKHKTLAYLPKVQRRGEVK